MTFQHKDDVCYFAYHYPYTYSTLKVRRLQSITKINIYTFRECVTEAFVIDFFLLLSVEFKMLLEIEDYKILVLRMVMCRLL